MRLRRALPALLTAALLAAPSSAKSSSGAAARESGRGQIVVQQPWARPTPPGVTVGAAYFTIRNRGAKADALTGFSSALAGRVELHETKMDGGMMRMRPLTRLAVPARGSVAAEPGGVHLMLIDLKQPLAPGQRLPLRLQFARAGIIDVEVVVRAQP